MTNRESFVMNLATKLAECDHVQSFQIGFRTITSNGEDEIVPDVQVVKKE